LASPAKPVVIEVGLNEATTREENPWVPISPEEIAADALRCAEAGASIVHFHARDPETGEQRLDATDLYRAAVEAIRAAGCDVLLYPSYPAFLSGRGDPLAERFGHVLALADDPDLDMRIAPLDMGSLNLVFADGGQLRAAAALPLEWSVYQNPFPLLERMAEQCDARGLLVTLAIFEPGHLRGTLALIESGRLRHPMLKFMLNGRWLHGPLPDPAGLDVYVRTLDALRGDREIPWMCAPSGIASPEPIEDAAACSARAGRSCAGGSGRQSRRRTRTLEPRTRRGGRVARCRVWSRAGAPRRCAAALRRRGALHRLIRRLPALTLPADWRAARRGHGHRAGRAGCGCRSTQRGS
jgi:uncharacterized protein (DUF849 family)